MQKTLPIFGLFAIMFVGLIAPAMAEDGDWQKHYEIEKEYDEKRHQFDEKYHKEFEELDRYYSEQKMAMMKKIENDSSLSEEDADRMFEELYEEYDTKLQHIKDEMYMAFEELEEQFEKEMGYDRYEDDDYDAAEITLVMKMTMDMTMTNMMMTDTMMMTNMMMTDTMTMMITNTMKDMMTNTMMKNHTLMILNGNQLNR